MTRRLRRSSAGLLATTLATTALALLPAVASATFHEISVREVYPGSTADPNAEYVELQMWNSGQELVGGHVLHVYGPTAATVADTLLPSDVANGVNQATILIASPSATTQFGVEADFALSSANQLDPSAGAVCWESLDCVSWGSFSGSLPSPAGTPAAAIPDEMALRRTIAPSCATLLEGKDDRDNSAQDFAAVFPSPRPNSVAPSEHGCTSNGGGQGGGESAAPQTTIKRKPPRRTHDRTPTFRFAADQSGVTFQCKLDRRRFRSCRSPFTAKRLGPGRHTFAVRARNSGGTVDPTPASYSFRVIGG